MKLLITGGNGNIAKIIKKNMLEKYDITCITRNDFDITDQFKLENYTFFEIHFDLSSFLNFYYTFF
jgi:dTDP-4-dehydrorhamnose reductase